jgi:uncharacterized protein
VEYTNNPLYVNNLEQIRHIAKNHFTNARGSHRWDHTLRVYRLAMKIAREEQADEEIVAYAALLHDIGRPQEDESKGRIDHAREGARMAETLLEVNGLEPEKIQKVVHCIASHRFRDGNIPESLEAKVVFDADKLDSIGAVGIGRAFLFAGENGSRLHVEDQQPHEAESYGSDDTAYHEYLVKLRKIKDRLLTQTGQKLARERHEFMVEFFDRLNKEAKGLI